MPEDPLIYVLKTLEKQKREREERNKKYILQKVTPDELKTGHLFIDELEKRQ